jgi:hypothetical protein
VNSSSSSRKLTAASAFPGIEHHALRAELLAQALAHELGRRHAPARLRVRAQLLDIGVGQAKQHGGAVQGSGRIDVRQRQRGQHRRGRWHGLDRQAGAEIVDRRAHRLVRQGRAATEKGKHQAKSGPSQRRMVIVCY